MRRFPLAAIAAVLLAGPTALAFFTGGYFNGPADWAGFAAWVLVALAALFGGRPPRSRSALIAIAGLTLFAGWTLASALWAPIAGTAYHAGQVAFLYLGGMLAVTLAVRGRALELVEVALAAGALIVIGYGLSNRLLPGVLHFAASSSADGRLEQPLTYWNAMGELAALGFVLCARIAGDGARPRWLRAVAAAASAPLGLGLYISFSRGALFACFAGLVALFALAPYRRQLLAILLTVAAGGIATAVAAPMRGITALSGQLSTRETQGAIMLGSLLVIALLVGLAWYRGNAWIRDRALPVPRRTPLIAMVVIAAALALAIIVGAHETSGTARLANGANRLTSFQSNRYDYWSVAFRAFRSEPLRGVGAGGWSVDWLRWRHAAEYAQDAHSLELQTLAELGIVGIVLLAVWIGGLVAAARRALQASAWAVGPVAGLVVYFAHSPLDWDWQMPALTLVAIGLAGAVLVMSQAPPRSDRGADAAEPARAAAT